MQVKSFFANVLHIENAVLNRKLADISGELQLSKGDFLIREGEKQTQFIFLLEGILRGFFLDAGGREITDCFGFACGTPGMSCFVDNEPSPISIEAVTECKLLCLPSNQLKRLMTENSDLLWIYNEFLQAALRAHWEIKTMVCQHTAMERYQWFLNTYPGLIDKVSNKHIASFLGMTPVTLSRLRRVIREQTSSNNRHICISETDGS